MQRILKDAKRGKKDALIVREQGKEWMWEWKEESHFGPFVAKISQPFSKTPYLTLLELRYTQNNSSDVALFLPISWLKAS